MKQNIVEITKGKTGTGLLLENDGYVSLELPGNKKLYESIKLNEATGQRTLPEKLIFDTVFQKFDTPNANGRIYPEAILKREVEKYQQAIKERRAYGEGNHPDSSTIDLSRIAMNIIELHWEGKTLVGKIEVPITDGYRNFGIVSTCADQVAHWILSGLKIGVSSRGLGSVTQRNGILYVGDDFEIICWDVVTQPSTPNAWICTEEGEISLYKENVEMNKNKTIFNENIENKYSKFEKWLTD